MNFYRYNGILNIYKETGWTSMDVCAKLRGVLGVRKVGHAGTLDPMAEGVLPVAVGRATRDIDLIGGCDKEYEACMLLGLSTDTQDINGEAVYRHEGVLPSEEEVIKAALSFEGDIEQLTPMYSARKVNGKKLYEYARAGVEVERKKKTVTIYNICIKRVELPRVIFSVRCSKGTYIRTLCHDIGAKLGCGACMESLKRTRVGNFREEEAFTIGKVEELEKKGCLDLSLMVAAPTAVAIGKFDGTHIGHQALLKELKKTAQEKKLKTLVLALRMGKSVITDEELKKNMARMGIDYCIEMEFGEEIRNMPAGVFLKELLIDKYHMKAIVAGNDLSFGKDREGDVNFIKKFAPLYGYEVRIIKKVGVRFEETPEDKHEKAAGAFYGETIVSSTLLRKELLKGDMLHVTKLLGRPYAVTGRIVHGRHIGSELMAMPTFNICLPENLILPPFGVYAAQFYIYGKNGKGVKISGKGIANIGLSPTVAGEGAKTPVRLETHAFCAIGDCYGLEAAVELMYFIRSERKFGNLDELKEQITGKDMPAAFTFFKTLEEQDVIC